MPRWLETALVGAAALTLLTLIRIAVVNIATFFETQPDDK